MFPPVDLEVNSVNEFSKSGNRVFPLDTPIDLIDLERNAVAKIKVTSFTNDQNTTSGFFQVIKLYQGDEKKILSAYWLENQ